MNPQSREWSVAWQMQAERRDGPKYVEAIRGAWLMRGIAFWSSPMSRHLTGDRALSYELLGGIPAWFR